MTIETTDTRRGAVDLARAGALLLVVAGHLLLAVIDRSPGGTVRGANLIALEPSLGWLGLLSPMPVFFVAAGWAASGPRADTTLLPSRSTVSRIRSLTVLVWAATAAWAAVAVAEQLVTGKRGVLTDGARIATQPFWFLAAYVPFSLAGCVLARAGRRPVLWSSVCVAFAALSDCARFLLGWPRWTGLPGFLVVWSVPWVIGAWWRTDCRVRARRERTTGVVLSVIGAVAGLVLVRWFGYAGTLIDAVPGRRSNSTPPTFFTLVATVSQAGMFMLCAGALDSLSGRWERAVAAVGTVATEVYVWHLTALALVTAPLVAGVPFPVRFTLLWWLLRPVWSGAVVLVMSAIIRTVRHGRERDAEQNGTAHNGNGHGMTGLRSGRIIAAGLLVTVGAGAVGLWGPTTPLRAVSILALLGGGSRLLRNRHSHRQKGERPRCGVIRRAGC